MLSLRDIYLQRGSFTLKEVSFDVKERDYFVILGRTGSGKTLLLETIAGFHQHGGSISFCGRNLTAVPPERRKVGFVYQDFALFPHLSVIQNIRFSERYGKRTSDPHWDELIDFLDLSHLLERNIHHLSGGEKQRVALARAIHSRPDILLLDEPLSAIDPSFRHSIMESLKGLNSRFNITVVHVTHNFREAVYLADKIGVMMNGRLVQHGAGQEVLNHPKSKAVAQFLGYKNILPARLLGSGYREGSFALNPALIDIDSQPLQRTYNMRGSCCDIREDLDHFALALNVDGSAVVVKIAKQNYDPAYMQLGVSLYLGFPDAAVTYLKESESCVEASV